MAEEENKEEETTQEKKKSNTLMIVIIAVLVLIILGAAVTAILLMSDDGSEAQIQQNTPQAQTKTISNRTRGSSDMAESRKLSDIGILYPLDGFTVNLKSDSGSRYLKVTISLELNGEELSIELDNKSPVIRDRIIRILTSKTLEEISSKKGKAKVSQQIMDTLNAMIVDGHIKGIYFTEFVIQ
ncbi:MAG: flagellar basal body-associated protein FliL [Sulfurimonas sp.]|uniref:flagellar basal body-associated protein FliL n=1 Tax=Sulfurimonas sp. TaxID=2022749 RepID=UPI002620399D|nr:flagellar basal body-associated protein FliL [Sulfurimonas sp.]MCW8894913.1 flagellar basal body-associated protein FliL [Sulfurimonas sp.]MCW8954820.1 flagellar basal body-associated protein FliL [Sulfurimonas sp.]MCW9068193.1 flagellar basal body-associated protein FliL [Sulfurimonas sp.]